MNLRCALPLINFIQNGSNHEKTIHNAAMDANKEKPAAANVTHDIRWLLFKTGAIWLVISPRNACRVVFDNPSALPSITISA